MPNYIRTKQIDQADLSGFFIDTIGAKSGLLLGYISGVTLNETVLLTGNQNVSGIKTFLDGVNLNDIDNLNLSGVDITITSGIVVLTNPVSAPNLVNITYNTGDQTISGIKTFALAISAPNLVYNTGNQTISGTKAFVARPTVNGTGVLLSGEVISLPVTIVYTTGDQTISGVKIFSDDLNISGDLTLNGGLYINDIEELNLIGANIYADNLVYNTGTQNISGLKIFKDGLSFVGNEAQIISFGGSTLSDNATRIDIPTGDSPTISITRGASLSSAHGYGIVFGGGPLGTKKGYLTSAGASTTRTPTGYQYATLDWTNRILSGEWSGNKNIKIGDAYSVLTTGDQTISGVKTFATGIFAPNLVYNTGDQTISGVKTFFDSGIFSNGGVSAVPLLNNPLSIVGSGDNYLQINVQNRATGKFASADLVITANNGTDNTNYIDLGINNVGYGDPQFGAGIGLDGYLYIDGGNLDIGTRTPNTSVEFHAGGATAANTIARISQSGLNIISGNLNLGTYIRFTNSPVLLNNNTTGEALLHIRANSTRPILAQSEFSGVTFAYQPSFIDKNSIVHLYAKNGLTTTDNFGFGSLNTMGTATARNVTGTNFYAATKRTSYATTSLSTAVGVRDDGSPQWMRGGSGFGGFYFKSRFGIGEMDAAISGRSRGFIGLTSLIGNVVSSNPSTRNVDMLGVGFDSGDSTWYFLHNSGANNSTKIPLVNYDCTRKTGNIIEFSMYAMPSSGVGFHVNISNSGNSFATGYYATTNLPALDTMMNPNLSLYHTNIVSVAGIALDINGVYIESFR